MTKFESSIKIISAPQEAVYSKLSDLNNLQGVTDKLPKDKIKNISFDADNISIEAANLGSISLKIIEREPCKCIKFTTTSSPIPLDMWIQIVPTSGIECKIKLTVGMELNPFMKGIVQKPLKEGIEKFAEILSSIPY